MPTKFYTAPGAVRREPGEPFASFAARQRESHLAGKPKKVRKSRPPSALKLARQRAADRIDGFDRDDIGPSVDY